MQLGTRWAVGDEPPANLPEVVRLAVHAAEEELAAVDAQTANWRWTLTWLENKPVIELDDGTVIRYNPHEDSATITQPADGVPDPFDEDDE
ncbi:hypothetical protein OSC27_08015 [Microbacterium sp. STN6]|uniref:hypothetical protein n=1 Tax=Microbacterium sp. STN6 TaxID=2995588 RepID=UPI002260C9D0|nr:hypothetical protein [Microbacterium sp. STN6]MCX7522221.1 hypothetical protein [Microbacterium sp. STN6]